jgi:hypothetical protein
MPGIHASDLARVVLLDRSYLRFFPANDYWPRRRNAIPRPHLEVYVSTQSQLSEPSSEPQRLTREIAINMGTGSSKAPGKIERVRKRVRTSFDDAEVKEWEKEKQKQLPP